MISISLAPIVVRNVAAPNCGVFVIQNEVLAHLLNISSVVGLDKR